jgi:hypothetical protein
MLATSVQNFIPLLAPVLAGIVGALGLFLKEWRIARDRRNVRQQALAEASAEVAFATDWWKAHQTLGTDPTTGSTAKALELLGEAEAKVTSTQHLSVRARRPVTFKRLFLAGPLHKRSARVLRGLFWISLGLLLIVSTTVTVELANNGKEVGEEITGVITLAVITVGLRAWAGANERWASPEGFPSDSPRHTDATPALDQPDQPR